MAEMTRRLQVLLDEPRWTRLATRAQRQGTSVANLVRSAIDVAYPDAGSGVAQTASGFLSRPPLDLPDWDQLKDELEHDPRPSSAS